MRIRRHQSDFEGCGLPSVLENPMSGADSRIGASKNNNVLHLSRGKTQIGRFLKVTCSDEVKDGAEALLKKAKHCRSREEDFEAGSTI
jgi:hypothetical protein